MSTSPARYHTFEPSNESSARLPPLQNAAAVRSQAVATLKRAASIPRTPDGRRPSNDTQDKQISVASQNEQEEVLGHLTFQPHIHDAEEYLSPSPLAATFDHSNLSPAMATTGMKRSASSSSSFHIPTPSHVTYVHPFGAPYYSTSSSASPTPDWAAMQFAQSYLPSPSHPPSSFPNTPVLGRNTPSPLPTLGELRTLSRSNSAAARAQAMSKLTGGKETPSDEDHNMHASSSRPNLQRADSLGTPTFGLATARTGRTQHGQEPLALNIQELRPRLQRSFTVSSSNMGEERRSAVGRRMMDRLAGRDAVRDQEREDEERKVRRLWEERHSASQENPDSEAEGSVDEDEDDTATLPKFERRSSVKPPQLRPTPVTEGALLVAPDRAISRNTMLSGEEAFEYEAHLRRSLSSRTARGTAGVTAQQVPAPSSQLHRNQAERHDEHIHGLIEHLPEEDPSLHQAPFHTPSRHVQQNSTSTGGTARLDHSPGRDSTPTRDALGSMLFVMGRGSASSSVTGGRIGEANWPMEVEENNGSDWVTPAKDFHQPTFNDSPLAISPLAPIVQHVASHPFHETHGEDGKLNPPFESQRSSVMSWEEVGGSADQEVPIDTHYYKKSGSMSAKIGRNIRTAMRKRSQSRSSVTSSNRTSPPTSPKILAAAIQSFGSRRGSETSVSPSQASVARSFAIGSPSLQQGDFIRRKPSWGSVAASVPGQPESSENSMLLQHQLSADPSPMLHLPRAELNDPRIHSSKLSPFPGIAHLERRVGDGSPLSPPPLLHQASDSVVPPQQHVTPASDSIYAIPLKATSLVESRCGSDDSTGKRNWLAKVFGQQTSPRTSVSVARRSSNQDIFGDVGRVGRKPSTDGHPSFALPTPETDPFAGPPLPGTKPTRHRSASPSVSTVPEVSDEGSRLTRFTAATQRVDNSSPLVEEDESEESGQPLPQKSVDVLNRMDNLLALALDDPARPDILDDPPRKLLLATQVLQVVNVNTAMDRFLFLFNDILVIAKPIISTGFTATLDMKYIVKSIVSLDRLHISGIGSEPTTEPGRHIVVQRFIEHFGDDPVAACRYLVDRSNPRVDAITIASLIFKTSELDKGHIGLLLSGNDKLMRAFIDRLHIIGVRIEDALRTFLLSLRLPADPEASQNLLRGFADRYSQVNGDLLGLGRETCTELVLAIMRLNDSLYGMYGFALGTEHLSEKAFVTSWRSTDLEVAVPDDQLLQIYASVRDMALAQALDSKQEKEHGRTVTLTPARLPTKITCNVWTDEIRISLPSTDSDFGIRLLGEGLEFDPPVLDFSRQSDASFRVRGTSLGTRLILFDRFGRNAALYSSLGNTRTFAVERAFMAHTFHVAFLSHTSSKRKYCFSVNDVETRSKWGNVLARLIAATRTAKSQAASRIGQAAEGVALQVLRDAVIPPEEKMSKSAISKIARSRSVSVAYAHQAGRNERDLGELQASKPAVEGDGVGGLMDIQTGKELVLLCRQNSLLPGLLESLQAGIGSGNGGGAQYSHERMECYGSQEMKEKGFTRTENVKARVPGGMV